MSGNILFLRTAPRWLLNKLSMEYIRPFLTKPKPLTSFYELHQSVEKGEIETGATKV